MEVIKAEVSLPKEAYELGLALAKIIIEGRKLLKDGLDAADLGPAMAILMSTEVAEGLKGLEKIGAEAKEDTAAVVMALIVAGTKAMSEVK